MKTDIVEACYDNNDMGIIGIKQATSRINIIGLIMIIINDDDDDDVLVVVVDDDDISINLMFIHQRTLSHVRDVQISSQPF